MIECPNVRVTTNGIGLVEPSTLPLRRVIGPAARWRRDVVVAGQKVIEADPGIVDAFKSTGYSLEAAVADLVDNSIDAGAELVLIRFLRTENEIVSGWLYQPLWSGSLSASRLTAGAVAS